MNSLYVLTISDNFYYIERDIDRETLHIKKIESKGKYCSSYQNKKKSFTNTNLNVGLRRRTELT